MSILSAQLWLLRRLCSYYTFKNKYRKASIKNNMVLKEYIILVLLAIAIGIFIYTVKQNKN